MSHTSVTLNKTASTAFVVDDGSDPTVHEIETVSSSEALPSTELPISTHAEQQSAAITSKTTREGGDPNNAITPPPSDSDAEAKTEKPSLSPRIRRRLFDFTRQRDASLEDLSSRIKANANGNDDVSATIKASSEKEMGYRPELLRKMASCLTGCLMQKTSDVPDDDEQYEPLFHSGDHEKDADVPNTTGETHASLGNATTDEGASLFTRDSPLDTEENHTLMSHS